MVRTALSLVSIAVFLACSGAEEPPAGAVRLVITPAGDTLLVGETRRFRAGR